MLICCQTFAEWWSDTEVTISTAHLSAVAGEDRQGVGVLRIQLLEAKWTEVNQRYKEYKSSVSDFSIPQLPFD